MDFLSIEDTVYDRPYCTLQRMRGSPMKAGGEVEESLTGRGVGWKKRSMEGKSLSAGKRTQSSLGSRVENSSYRATYTDTHLDTVRRLTVHQPLCITGQPEQPLCYLYIPQLPFPLCPLLSFSILLFLSLLSSWPSPPPTADQFNCSYKWMYENKMIHHFID